MVRAPPGGIHHSVSGTQCQLPARADSRPRLSQEPGQADSGHRVRQTGSRPPARNPGDERDISKRSRQGSRLALWQWLPGHWHHPAQALLRQGVMVQQKHRVAIAQEGIWVSHWLGMWVFGTSGHASQMDSWTEGSDCVRLAGLSFLPRTN